MGGSWWRVLIKCGPLEKGVANNSSILAMRTPRGSVKRQKAMTPEDEPSMLECIQYATGEEQRAIMNSSTRNEVARLKWK